MQRTFNYTNRKRIERSHVRFDIESGGQTPEFKALFHLPEQDLPADASVFVEAYCKETRQRFEFGNVSRIVPPGSTKLDELDLSAPVQFRVLVVDETGKHGKIVASGQGFKPAGEEENDNRSSLLPVFARPMDDVVWKVEINTGGKPELSINNRIPDGIDKVKSDPLFQAMILPAAMREVLMRYLWDAENYDGDDNFERWIQFAELLAGTKPDEPDPELWMRWIDECVEAFSRKFNMCDLLCYSLGGHES